MKCDACKNKSICKYVEKMCSIEDEVKAIKMTPITPIKIDIKCSSFMNENSCTGGMNTGFRNNIKVGD